MKTQMRNSKSEIRRDKRIAESEEDLATLKELVGKIASQGKQT